MSARLTLAELDAAISALTLYTAGDVRMTLEDNGQLDGLTERQTDRKIDTFTSALEKLIALRDQRKESKHA